MFKRIFKQWSKPIEDEDVEPLADAIKYNYERAFLSLGPNITSCSTDSPYIWADTGGLGSIRYSTPVIREYHVEEEEEDFVYCDNCHCIIPDEHLRTVGNCNHCGAPPPKGLKHAR